MIFSCRRSCVCPHSQRIRDAFFALWSCRQRALKAASAASLNLDVDAVDSEDLRLGLAEIWEKRWARCEEMGAVAALLRAVLLTPFTQESLVVYVDIIK